MKKLVAMALAATMMLSTPVVAAEVDLSGMTLDELVTLKTSISEEISARTADESNEIGNGEYVVGTDIKAGSFKFENTNDKAMNLFVYENEAQCKSRKHSVWDYLGAGDLAYLALKEGNILSLDGVGTLEEVKQSWAPGE